ncbi:hypothetical protein PVAND_000582 [Polypedilum vanderplanki]|uniref:Cytochrome P450 n=1 Tax=Polypedilum vanderplanki TaxID=319348 RepID=A0A9J6BKL6_POLVA|nr:hypothetical protein PVAND_000582 [Polypedilum vanderplanki]
MNFIVVSSVLVAICSVLVAILMRKIKNWIPQDLDKFFQSVDRLSSKKLFKVKFLYKDMYFVNDPNLIHKVLTSDECLEKPQMIYKFFGLSDGFLCCKFNQWKRDRKNFSCSFNNVMVNAFTSIFCEIADRMVEKIKEVGCGQKDIIYFTERCTISMILASSFNIFPNDVENNEERINEVATAVKIQSTLLCERFRKFHLFFDALFRHTNHYRKITNLKNYLLEILFKEVDRKNRRIEANNEKVPNFVGNIFFNKLLFHKNEMTLNQFKDSITTVIGAGFETTGTASAHCILFLAMHPEIQEKAYQEILSIYPSNDDEITLESLTKLEYIERVMKESLRLGPTVHSIAREAMRDFELIPNKIAKKGSIFCINIYGLHRRKDLWGDDAELFNPDRFLPENFEDKQKYFLPFSVGRRNCIGYRYAYTSFKIMMIKLLRNFKFTTNLKLNEIKFNRQIALKLTGEHLVMIEQRN